MKSPKAAAPESTIKGRSKTTATHKAPMRSFQETLAAKTRGMQGATPERTAEEAANLTEATNQFGLELSRLVMKQPAAGKIDREKPVEPDDD